MIILETTVASPEIFFPHNNLSSIVLLRQHPDKRPLFRPAMQFDPLAEKRLEGQFLLWTKTFLEKSPEQLSMQYAEYHAQRVPKSAALWKTGSLNVCYRVKFDEGPEAIVRFAAMGRTIFRAEKVENEVAVLQYLRQNTSIPVPEVIGSGDCWGGPYIVMSFMEGQVLSLAMKDPDVEDREILNPQVSERSLRACYRGMARFLLELYKPEFPRIGSLKNENGEFVVAKRPFTLNMNQLSTWANLPRDALPDQTFESTSDYMESLANQHMSHFMHQRNNAVVDEADCRKKYIARCLFRKIVKESSFECNEGPFRLYCDDFRPSNMLFDIEEICIGATIDWEFTYAAPAEFSYIAPWWLLLQSPEDWESDLNQFLERYTPRFHLYLEALRQAESEMIEKGALEESQRLSPRMEQSLDNGLFWLCMAARYSSMFDEIYWSFIDEKYFGKFTAVEDRVQHLSQEEQGKLDEIYEIKMEQADVQRLDDNYTTTDLINL